MSLVRFRLVAHPTLLAAVAGLRLAVFAQLREERVKLVAVVGGESREEGVLGVAEGLVGLR